MKNRTNTNSRLIAALVFTLSIVLSAIFFIFKDYFKDTLSLGLLGLFIINFVSSATLFISAPAFLTVIAGGSMYPPILVALFSSSGSAAGEILSFIFGLSGRKIINHKLEKKIWFKVLNKYFEKYGGLLLFLFSLIPNPVFDSLGIIAGVFSYSPLKFLLLVFTGRFIRYFLLAKAGSIF